MIFSFSKAACVASVLSVLGCQNEVDSLQLRERTQAQVTATPFLAYEAAVDTNAVLLSSEWMEVGDRVVVSRSGAAGGIANSGMARLTLGAESRVGSTWAAGTLELRDRARIEGDVYLSNSTNLVRGNSTTITGVVNQSLGSTSDLFSAGDTLTVQGGNMNVEPGQTVELQPGRYGDLTVKQNATAKLSPGEYSFGRIQIENGAFIQTDEACAVSRVRARTSLTFRGKVKTSGDFGGYRLVVSVEGTETAHVESGFDGWIIAPNAELILSSQSHTGRFMAKRLRVQSEATIRGEDLLQCRTSEDVPSGSPQVKPTQPAPAFEDVGDLDAFLAWFYQIPRTQIDDARDAIKNVTNSSAVASEVAVRLAAMRSAHRLGPAYMLLAILGAMEANVAEQTLIDLVNEPITENKVNSEGATPYDEEVSYRRRALFELTGRGTASAQLAIENAAYNHANEDIRWAGLRALSFGKNEAERETIKSQIRPEDRHAVDRPNRQDPDFAARYQYMKDNYSN